MRTVSEVSKLTGVSIRTLQYYDKIGLLKPSLRTEAGYRLYDDTALERLQHILLFRELEFSLTDIQTIIDAPDFEREKALRQQIELLVLKRERLDGIIAFAREIEKGGSCMNFEVFDTGKLEEFSERAKAEWGNTKEYAEYAEKSKDRSVSDNKNIADGLMRIFHEFGKFRGNACDTDEVKNLVKKLQLYITEHYYKCENEMLASLGKMYAANEEFRTNIDKAGGEGTAEFASREIGRAHV